MHRTGESSSDRRPYMCMLSLVSRGNTRSMYGDNQTATNSAPCVYGRSGEAVMRDCSVSLDGRVDFARTPHGALNVG